MRDHFIVWFLLSWIGMAMYIAFEMAVAPEVESVRGNRGIRIAGSV